MYTAHTRQIITLFLPSLFFLCICLTVFYHGFQICFVIFFLLLLVLVLLYARLHKVVDHQSSFIMNILLELSICIFLASIDRQFELQKQAIFTNLFAFDSLLFRLVFFSHKTKLTWKPIQFTCSFHLFCQRKGDKQKPSSFFFFLDFFCSFCCYVCISFSMHWTFHCAWSLMILSVCLKILVRFFLASIAQRTDHTINYHSSERTAFSLSLFSTKEKNFNIFQTQSHFWLNRKFFFVSFFLCMLFIHFSYSKQFMFSVEYIYLLLMCVLSAYGFCKQIDECETRRIKNDEDGDKSSG